MRPEKQIKGQNKVTPSIDTKNLNAIITQYINEGKNVCESNKLMNVIYIYYLLDIQLQSMSVGLFDFNSDDSKNAFVEMLTKYGFLRKHAIGKTTFGIVRMVNTSSNMLPLTAIRLNSDTGKKYKVRYAVNRMNIRELIILLSFQRIRKITITIKEDGCIFKGASQFKFDYLPSFGNIVYFPGRKKILVVNRQPTKGQISMLPMIAEVLGLETGAYINSLVVDLLDGDYDGDELSISKLRERASKLGTYITMSVAGLL